MVTVGGAASDGINFTAQPQIINISPQPAALAATVTITGENFGAAQGGSIVTCNGSPTNITSWSASTITLSSCLNLGPNPIQIIVNEVSSATVSIDGIPDATISNVNPMTAPVGSRVLIRGQSFGAAMGQSSVTINGVTTTPISWSDSAIAVTVPVGATGNGIVNVVVGGFSASFYGFQVGTYPAPNSLRISPIGVTLLVGQTQQFTAVDEFGRPRADATWTVDNTNLATITTAYSPVLTAVSAGLVTITAIAQGVSAQTQVTISALASLPPGTSLWSAPPVPGFTPAGVFQAAPMMFGPDLYSVQTSADGTQATVQALTADGQVMSEGTMPWPYGGTSVPDGFGGLLVVGACNSSISAPLSLSDWDGVSGAQLWQIPLPTVLNGSSVCLAGTLNLAVRQDGAVVVTFPLQMSPRLLILDGRTGAAIGNPTIPPSTYINTYGQPTDCDCFTVMGQPIVDSDGSIYEEYAVSQQQLINSQSGGGYILPLGSISSAVSLLKIAPDNSTTTTQLSSSTTAALVPGNIIPDGQGGVLATWIIENVPTPANNFTPFAAPQPYQAADVSSGTILSNYPLPYSQVGLQTLPLDQYGSPIAPPLVLGENSTAFASFPGVGSVPSSVSSFNLNSGAGNWNHSASGQNVLSMVEATPDGGLTINDSSVGVTQLDTGGNVLGTAAYLQGASPLTMTWWVGLVQGIVGELYSPDGSNGIPSSVVGSTFPTPKGNSQGQHQSPFCQRANSKCALVVDGDTWSKASNGPYVRVVTYRLATLSGQNLTLRTGAHEIVLGEELISGSPLKICNPMCSNKDEGYSDADYPDTLSVLLGGSFSTWQTFWVDRGLMKVYRRHSDGNYYGSYRQQVDLTFSIVTITPYQPDLTNPVTAH